MKDLVEYIITSLVEKKDHVVVTESREDRIVTIHISVAEDELGKVIGKNGKIAQSIRAIVNTATANDGLRYIVKIGE